MATAKHKAKVIHPFIYTLFALLYFTVFALIATFPLVLHISDTLPGVGDELLITGILNWNIHSFTTNSWHMYEAPIFFPYHNTLAYSEAFFVSSIIGIIPKIIFNTSASIYNFNLLAALISLGFCTYLLTKYITKSTMSSIVAGTLVTFSTYTITKTMHLQLLGIFLLPLSLLFIYQFIDQKKLRYLVSAGLCIVLQSANSFQPVYFLGVSIVAIFLYYYFFEREKLVGIFNKKNVVITFLTLFFVFLFALPYLQVSREFHYTRDIRDTIHFANRIEYTFYPSNSTRLSDFLKTTIYKDNTGPYFYDGYMGFAFFLLFIVAFSYRFILKKNLPQMFNAFFFLGIFAFVLSLGPALQWGGKVIKLPFIIPLPYALFYYVVPGFNGMRNSARWEMLFLLAISIAIGIFLSHICKQIPQKIKWAVFVLICGGVMAEIVLPMPLTHVPTQKEMPKVYVYVATLPKNTAIIEMPIYNWDMYPYAGTELWREYYSTFHYKRMVNGYSGFSPLVWEDNVRLWLANFPSSKTLQAYKNIGVTYIIVHKNEYDTMNKNKYKVRNSSIKSGQIIVDELIKNPLVTLDKKFGDDYVFKIK